jgi:hypothetical protein
MPAVFPSVLDCTCSTSTAEDSTAVPGPAGEDGADGAAGTDGRNAWTTVAQEFVMPAVDATVADVVLEDGGFIGLNQILYIEGAGYMKATVVTSDTVVTLENIGTDGNASEGDPIPVGSKVSPGGNSGSDGASGAAATSSIRVLTNRTALKALTTPASPLHPIIVFLTEPETGVSRSYKSVYGSSATADDISVIAPTDGLCRYFEYNLA